MNSLLALYTVFLLGTNPEMYPVSFLMQNSTEETPNPDKEPTKKDLEKAMAFFQEGDAQYKLGEYQKALDAFKKSYLYSREPVLLLNIGQCYRYMNKYNDAKRSYENFLKEDPKSAYRQETEQKIKEVQELIDKETALVNNPTLTAPTTQKALPPMIVTFPEPPKNPVRTALIGGSVGVAVVGGALLTLFIVNKASFPDSTIGDQEVSFRR